MIKSVQARLCFVSLFGIFLWFYRVVQIALVCLFLCNNKRSQTTAITPESIRPFPKAAPRKAGVVKKKLSSEVLTSTPVKERLKAEFAERKLKCKGQKRKLNVTEKEANEVTETSVKTTRKGKSRGNSSKGKQLQQSRCSRPKKKKWISDSDDSDVEPECFCIVCTEPWSNSRSNDKWIQCISCHQWAHLECTASSRHYVCHHCDSESE